MVKTVDAASSAVTGSFGVIATIVAVERSVVHSDIQNFFTVCGLAVALLSSRILGIFLVGWATNNCNSLLSSLLARNSRQVLGEDKPVLIARRTCRKNDALK
jgi:NADH:ubiquinone oxidoreductase subunit H